MAVTLNKKGTILLARGIDASLPAEYLQDQFATNSINFNLVANILEKRNGFTKVGNTSSAVGRTIMAGTIFTREEVDYNVRITKSNVERFEPGSETWVDITDTVLTGDEDDTISVTTPLLSGYPILCIANGVDTIRKWTGSGNIAPLGGTPPIAKFIKEYKTYLVCANIRGGIDNGQRVQWSDTADPENWTTGNSGALDLVDDNDDITGLNLFGDSICVHKDNSIYLGYLVSSSAVFQFVRKNTGVGTIANNSIVNLPTGEQVFLASDGLRIFNGITATLLDAPINEEIRRTLNRNYAKRSWGILLRDKDEVWFGLPTGSEEYGQTIYKFNYVNRTVYKNVVANVNCAWIGASDSIVTWNDLVGTWDEQTWNWNDSAINQGDEKLNIGNTLGETWVNDDFVKSDNGNSINAFYDSKDFQNDQESISRWTELQVWAKGQGNLTVSYSTNEGETWSSIGNSPLVLSESYPTFDSPQILYFDTVSTKIRFRFQNNTATDTVYIKQFIVKFRDVGFRR
jgi:hypothetical protein